MIKIFLLIWFLIPPGGGDNILQIQYYTSLAACKEAGDFLNAASQQAQTDKHIITFGGTCYEVPNSNNGST